MISASLNSPQTSFSLQYMTINTETHSWSSCRTSEPVGCLVQNRTSISRPFIPRLRVHSGRRSGVIVKIRGNGWLQQSSVFRTWTYRGYDCMYKTCTRSSQPSPQQAWGRESWISTPGWGRGGISLLPGRGFWEAVRAPSRWPHSYTQIDSKVDSLHLKAHSMGVEKWGLRGGAGVDLIKTQQNPELRGEWCVS